MKFGQLFAATTASMAPNVREQVRDANDASDPERRDGDRANDDRKTGRRAMALVEYSQRATRRGGRWEGASARASRALKRDKNARGGLRARTPRMGTVRARWWASSARRRRTEGGETRERLEGVD